MNARLRQRIGVAAAGGATFLNMYAPQSLLPTLAEQFGIGAAQAGLLMTATLVAVACVAPFAGSISDMVGRKRLIAGACFALVVPVLLSAVAPGFAALVLFRFLQGLLLPFVFTVTVAYIADECEPTEAVKAMSTYATGAVVGGFLGRFIAGWSTALAGWEASFLALAALTLACAVVILVFLPTERRFKPVLGLHSSLQGFVDQFSNVQVVATCWMGFSVLFSMVAAFTFITLRLADAPYDLGPAELGSMFAVYLAGVVATPVSSRLSLRFGRRWTVQASAVFVVGGLLLTLLPSLTAVLLGLGLMSGGIFAEQVLSLGYVALAARRARSTAVGLYATCYYTGGALGSILPAGIWYEYGWFGCVAMIVLVQWTALVVVSRVWPQPVT